MRPEDYPPGSPADWMRHARSDLELAKTAPHPNILLEELCFHAQQAAEKALKALLLAKNLPFPRTHNLRILLDLLVPVTDPPPEVQAAAGLTDYAVAIRYPGTREPITEEERREAVQSATHVVQWAASSIQE